jgi:hypothetical protein
VFGSDILEIAIGKEALYLVLSLVCSAITEAFARASAMRSRTLTPGIRNVLSDPDCKGLAKRHEMSRSELGWVAPQQVVIEEHDASISR